MLNNNNRNSNYPEKLDKCEKFNVKFFKFKVRKTSIRMTAIKEYPFDLSDIKNSPSESTGDTPAQAQPTPAPPVPSRTSVPEKRKVSIMADADSKDRENLPSDR